MAEKILESGKSIAKLSICSLLGEKIVSFSNANRLSKAFRTFLIKNKGSKIEIDFSCLESSNTGCFMAILFDWKKTADKYRCILKYSSLPKRVQILVKLLELNKFLDQEFQHTFRTDNGKF